MKIVINDDAAKWYEDNLNLQVGDAVRFYGKVYGSTSGFSLAVTKQEPSRPDTSVDVNGVTYYIEAGDAWFFEEQDLVITLDPERKEPKYDKA